ncbi:PREDICTED: trace amine-associated receptor 13c-like [Cyprinodon variegatus]|uniref:trace amine-associated receptor 13c-like n=1 Tax=Cyprinodon variegatus TaxID=28743 RepID=UPI000742BB34|nr:PREDICTED: trace amine-associated receptor 13c-like [Cyprinodon variegatus]
MEALREADLCFPQLLNVSCLKPVQHHAENLSIYIVLSCISFITVTLNLIVIISISHFRQLQTPTNLFLLSLAVSDFLVGLLLMPIQILLTGGCWVLGSFMCGLFQFSSFMITSASVGTMVLISADRYVAICDPLHYPTIVTPKRVKICVCLCWACAVIYNGMIMKDFLKNPDIYNSCYGECVLLIDSLAGYFDIILTFLGPVTVIIVLYLRVFVVAVSQARAMRSHIAAVSVQGSLRITAKKSERKAATALGVVVVLFVVCFCPYFYPYFAGEELLSNDKILLIAIWIFLFNSCVNPIIYAFFYPWFRKSAQLIVTLHILQPQSCDANIL